MTVAAKKPRKLTKLSNPEKTTGFAIGVTPEHYWMITGMAAVKNSNRTVVLEEIIDHYIKTGLAKGRE